MIASVIIITFNGKRFLEPCLEAVLAQQLEGPFEVILVDNGSSDGSADFVRAQFPAVRIIEAGRNLGFAGGNNLGIRSAQGRYLVLLNNDTRVRPEWLQALVRAAEEDVKAGAVTAKLLFMDPPNTIQNAGSLLLSDGSGADRGFQEPDRGQYDRREEVFGACGAAALYRREMLDDVGLFDETFFMYYEDTDLNWRMRLRGWKVLYEPAAVVDHVHAGSSTEWSPFFIFHVDRNRMFLLIKNAPPLFTLRALSSFAGKSARTAAAVARRRLSPSPLRAGPPAHASRADRATRAFEASQGRESHQERGRGRARLHARVAISLLIHLPEMLAKRRRIRRRRRVPDSAITRWFFPREQWDAR